MNQQVEAGVPAPLAGRLAVVTGGASGLGLATARMLRDAGAGVVILDADGARAAAVAADLGIHALPLDVSDDPAAEACFDRIEATHGPVSILVCCAGVATPGPVTRRGAPMDLAEFRRVLDINLMGSLNCIRCAVPQMIRRGRAGPDGAEAGVIVLTSSIAASDGQMGQAAYAASKGGVAGMVLPLARELGDHAIRIAAIAPGVFRTPMTEGLPEKSRDVVFAALPPFPKRAGTAEDFADAARFVIGNAMINGETIRLDGGLRMPARL
ncbi:SDR family oxidoreductase [Pseudooceanicola aestuarii]|uniref:SDR family oxidoreductase n=1 Tax=Pseudooceanicola aestuarii TaxID=2697319 RepID=UPI0013D005A3|nr:SDR family oxidoreductase [Pseudooceanicola aestuarii]